MTTKIQQQAQNLLDHTLTLANIKAGHPRLWKQLVDACRDHPADLSAEDRHAADCAAQEEAAFHLGVAVGRLDSKKITV